MSTKPNPVALTAAMLALRSCQCYQTPHHTVSVNAILPDATEVRREAYQAASLASQLHRLQPAFKRHAEALCNGEWREGERDKCNSHESQALCIQRLAILDLSIEKYGVHLERKLAKLNALLAPLAVQAHGDGDPRGCVLYLTSTNGTPIPHNDMSGDRWAI